MNKKLRVAAYCRVSSDRDDQANSLISQRKYFAEYIERHEDWQLIDVYYDEGISGTQTKKRVGFNTMIEDAVRGEIDLILTKEVSRFARNTVDTLSYTRKLMDINVGVIFTIDNIDTRVKDGELRLSIMASIAQEESRKTSERVKWGQKRRMEQGVVFGRDLLGYTVKNGVLSINEEEAAIVREVFHKYTNEGKGSHVIARELSEAGMRPKRVKLWSNVIILRILRNEKYVGDLCQKKTYTPNYLSHAKKYNRGAEEKVYIRDHHEPIISRELWDRTQAELKRRSPSQEMLLKHSNRYWESGKLVCGECGQRFVSRTKKLVCGETYKAWRCHAQANHGSRKVGQDGEVIGCDNNSISDRALDYCMEFCISSIQNNQTELKEEILSEIRRMKQNQEQNRVSDTTMLEKRIDELNDKKRKAIDLVLDGILSKGELKKQQEWYDEEIRRLETQMMEVRHNEKIYAQQIDNMKQYIDVLDEIMTFKAPNEQLYREILKKIVIYRDGVLIIWLNCIPFGIKLKVRNSGRMENYHTEVLEMDIVEDTNIGR